MKSPLKDKPLRNPGQTLDQEIYDLLYDDVLQYFMISTVAIIMAMIDWYRWYFKVPADPWPFSILALVAVLVSTVKIIRVKKKIKYLKQGRDGERAVGQYLERLRENGCKVFHDIPSKGFNLDHVVISKSGIYVIETKSYSKPDKGEAKIIYNGDAILLNGTVENKKPVIQAKAAASWLRELLGESTGRKFNIKPVIVFPGWFIEPTAEAKSSDVWALNPKALPAFIDNSKEQLKDDEMHMVSLHLSRYVRSYEG